MPERDRLVVSTVLPATPAAIYAAWLDGEAHGELTGGALASVEPTVGGAFTAWDGYISGRILALEPDRLIVQAWRTTAFAADDADSRLEVLLEPEGEGTRVTLTHTEIPAGQGADYEQGWVDYYFTPMATYFAGQEA